MNTFIKEQTILQSPNSNTVRKKEANRNPAGHVMIKSSNQ